MALTDIDEFLLTGARQWINHTTGLAYTHIIVSDQHIKRPTGGPYIEVSLNSFDEDHGVDELIPGLSADMNPTWAERSFRTGVLTLNGYGRGSAEIITRATMRLRRPSMLELTRSLGFSITPISNLVDVTAVAGNKHEKRFAKDFMLTYLLVDTEPQEMVEPTLFELDLTLQTLDLDSLNNPDLGALLRTLSLTC